MSFQELGPVMKPARVIKMQDGPRRPPGGSNLDDKKRAKFYFFSLSLKTAALYFPGNRNACLVLLHKSSWPVRRLKEPAGPGMICSGIGGRRGEGWLPLVECLCARPHASCSPFTILFNLHTIQ